MDKLQNCVRQITPSAQWDAPSGLTLTNLNVELKVGNNEQSYKQSQSYTLLWNSHYSVNDLNNQSDN